MRHIAANVRPKSNAAPATSLRPSRTQQKHLFVGNPALHVWTLRKFENPEDGSQHVFGKVQDRETHAEIYDCGTINEERVSSLGFLERL